MLTDTLTWWLGAVVDAIEIVPLREGKKRRKWRLDAA